MTGNTGDIHLKTNSGAISAALFCGRIVFTGEEGNEQEPFAQDPAGPGGS